MQPTDSYRRLTSNMKDLALLNTAAGLLSWDQEVFMPPLAAPHRAGQLSLLAGILHERFTSPETGELLAQALSSPELNANPLSDSAVNLREWKRAYDRYRKLPKDLVEEMARVTSQAQGVWVEARRENDYRRFEPWLERIVALVRRQADALGYEHHPYDALLDEYEPGLTVAELDRLFPSLSRELTALMARIQGSADKPDVSFLTRPCPVTAQKVLSRKLAEAMGFDFAGGRLDVSAHPFTTGLGPQDTRLTTRFEEDNFSNAFFSTLHEAGHGLYDQGLPEEHFGTPRGDAVSLGIHESQSRLWENQVGRSRPFWEHFFPILRKTFPGTFDEVGMESFLLAVNRVEPTLIRTESDEVTYNLHIVLRYEMEKKLVEGSLRVADIPEAWNDGMKRHLGLEVPHDAAGCLQDVHWSHGSFGYFPTYTLGNLYAAQFMEAARRDLPDLDRMFSRGLFLPLRNWLKERIHSQGQRWRAGDLCRQVTGTPLDPSSFLRYLTSKNKTLYHLP